VRIASLLPSSTEILFALGLGDAVVGVTHECDFPPQARGKRVIVRSRLPQAAEPAQIDRLVAEFIERGESIYCIDVETLRELDPDLIITQDLCHVCAASPDDLAGALSALAREPRVLSLNPHTLADVWADIRGIGAATGLAEAADTLVTELAAKVAAVASVVRANERTESRPRVLCLEWLDPPFNAGHWVPEMVALAGGEDVLAVAGKPSRRINWEEIAAARPEVIVVAPCGYDARKAAHEFARLRLPAEWYQTPASQQGRVFVTDANAYFSRPGPRLAEGVAVLAAALHPELLIPYLPPGSLRRLAARASAAV